MVSASVRNETGLRIAVLASFMTTASLCCTGIRLVIRRPWKVLWWYDDTFNVVAAGFGILHTVTCVVAVRQGLGKHDVGPDVNQMRQALYASNALSVLAVATTQLSVGFLLRKVLATCNQQQYRSLLICMNMLQAAIITWGIIGVCISSWPPGHTASGKVNPQVNVFLGLETSSLVLDLSLVGVSHFLFASLQISRRKRMELAAIISLRVLFHGPAISRYLALRKASTEASTSGELAWAVVWTSLQIHLLIIGAALPCLSPFFKTMNGGIVAATVLTNDSHSRLNSAALELIDSQRTSSVATSKAWKAEIPNVQHEWENFPDEDMRRVLDRHNAGVCG